MKRVFTDFKEWKAAVEAAGLSINNRPVHEGPHEDDQYAPVFALDAHKREVGIFSSYKDDADIITAWDKGEIDNDEADRRHAALPLLTEGLLFDNHAEFIMYEHEDEPDSSDLAQMAEEKLRGDDK